jgi:hypothetical protein
MLKITFLEKNDFLKKEAEKIAHKYNGYVVPDYEIEYKEMINRELNSFDFYRIAKGILNKELEYQNSSKKFLISINNPYLIYNQSLKQLGESHDKFKDILNNCNYNYIIKFKDTEYSFKNLNINNIKELFCNDLEFFIKSII